MVTCREVTAKGALKVMWFRRRTKNPKRAHWKPFDSALLAPKPFLTVAEATEEGLILTEYASRMSVKNNFIRGVLGGNERWGIERGKEVARADVDFLAREAETDADNLERIITRYRGNPGAERDSQGYGFDDIANMEHRRDVSRDIARRLREQRNDEEFLTELVHKARRDAWREVAANIEQNLDIEFRPVDADYARHRDHRMRALVDVDLAALIATSPAKSALASESALAPKFEAGVSPSEPTEMPEPSERGTP